MKNVLSLAAFTAALLAGVSGAFAQSGALSTAVGGYTFEEAAKPSPETPNFNNKDGKLTFAMSPTRPATASSTRPMSAPRWRRT
jgi:simple sugar transport system substrate-binding protein